MNKQPKISSEITPIDGKDWDETEKAKVTFTIETNKYKKVFIGNITLGARINKIQ